MDIVSGIVVYILLWWWVFFMALPVGNTPPKDLGEGHAASAPERPRLWLKAVAATVIAGVLFVGVYWFIAAEIISFRDMADKM